MDPAASANVDELIEHARWIRALALQLVRDAATADDLVQQTLLAALKHKPSAGHALRPWLARVTRNQAAMVTRGDARRHAREATSARDEALPSAADLAARGEQQKQLVEAVLELRDPYRSVLLLRYYEGLAPDAIAARQGLPGSTVRNQIARALAQLRERLDEHHGGDRRAWALMFVPLAAEAESPVASAGLFSALATGLVAMQLVTKLALTLCVLALITAITFFGCEQRPAKREQVAATPRPHEEAGAVFTGREETAVRVEDGAMTVGAAREELVIADAPSVAARNTRLRGEVRDKSRNLALADFEIVVDDGTREPEVLVTDSKGHFESKLEYASGELAITFRDREGTESLEFFDGGLTRAWPDTVERVTWSPGDELELRAVIGPSLRIAANKTVSDEWLASVYGGTPWEPNARFACERAPVRTGAPTWFRCAARALDARTDGTYWLSLVSADGLWVAWEKVRGSGDVAVEPMEAARLEIDVSSATNRVLEAVDVEVRALRFEHVRRGDSRWNGSQVIEDEHPNRFVFGGLATGSYEITARARGCSAASKRVTVVAGKVMRIELQLKPARGEAFVRGELRSSTGRFDTSVTVRLTPLSPASRDAKPLTQRCEFRGEGGELVGRFDFSALEPGAYGIQLIKNGAGHERWQSQYESIVAPVEGLVFTCQDSETLIDLRLRALQFDDDAPINGARWHYVIDGVEFSGTGPELVIEGVSPQSSFEWCVTAGGYVVSCGGWDGFWPAGRESFCEARLKRGWGAKIKTVEDRTRLPLEGVAIWLDGELAGRTNEAGVLLADRSREPRRLEPSLAGWRVASEARKLGVVVDDESRMVFVLPMSREP